MARKPGTTRNLKADLAGLLAELPDVEREFDAFLSGEIVTAGGNPEGEYVARAGKYLSVGSFALARVIVRRLIERASEIEHLNDIETLIKLGNFSLKGMDTVLGIYKAAKDLDRTGESTLADAFKELEEHYEQKDRPRDKNRDANDRAHAGVTKDGKPAVAAA